MKQENHEIEMFRMTLQVARRRGMNKLMASTEADGNNGLFLVPFGRAMLVCLVSDGMGWEHVSVSIHRKDRTPTWEEMCHIKKLFWGENEAVVQYHPRRQDYVNFHDGCLHMWRPTNQPLPLPPSILVGPR